MVTIYLMCIFTVSYCILFCPRDAWGGFTSDMLRHLGPNISLGLAGTAMVASESWAWEILSLASSCASASTAAQWPALVLTMCHL